MSDFPKFRSGQVGVKIPEHDSEFTEDLGPNSLTIEDISEELSAPKTETSELSKTSDEECPIEPIKDEISEDNPSESLSTESGKKGKVTSDSRKTEIGASSDHIVANKYNDLVGVLSTLLARLNESEVIKQCLHHAYDDNFPASFKDNAIFLRGAIGWLNTMSSFGLLKPKPEEHDPNCKGTTLEDSMKSDAVVSNCFTALSRLGDSLPAVLGMVEELKLFEDNEKDDKTTKSSTTTVKKPEAVRPKSGSKVESAIRSQADRDRSKKEAELYKKFDSLMINYEAGVMKALGF
ncbi:hypothetical protein NPIL_107101 [Nephila pilipes]|uniref:Uncharacterized protein n=1 Tax=Nephila pilipes TaxID=299642 RepID=A0A8X6N0F9_NEPPI|nr:hypothetical protein NPIL_107101 [Nephila pilipes]